LTYHALFVLSCSIIKTNKKRDRPKTLLSQSLSLLLSYITLTEIRFWLEARFQALHPENYNKTHKPRRLV